MMIDINKEKPDPGDMILAALTFGKDTKSFSDAIRVSKDIYQWPSDLSDTVFTRTEDGLFMITPLQWRPEYISRVTHWMAYPEHPLMADN